MSPCCGAGPEEAAGEDSDAMGTHRRSAAIFVDESGRRTRLARLMVRAIAAVLFLGVTALVVSLFGGVPLPGIDAPVALPSGERAHPKTHGLPTLSRPVPGATNVAAPGRTVAPAVSSGESSSPPETRVSGRAKPSRTTPAVPTAASTRARSGSGKPSSPGARTTPAQRNTSHGRPTAHPTHP